MESIHNPNGWVLYASDSQGAAATDFYSLTTFSAEDTQNTYHVSADGSFHVTSAIVAWM